MSNNDKKNIIPVNFGKKPTVLLDECEIYDEETIAETLDALLELIVVLKTYGDSSETVHQYFLKNDHHFDSQPHVHEQVVKHLYDLKEYITGGIFALILSYSKSCHDNNRPITEYVHWWHDE